MPTDQARGSGAVVRRRVKDGQALERATAGARRALELRVAAESDDFEDCDEFGDEDDEDNEDGSGHWYGWERAHGQRL
jgi:hypothetical protein